MSIKVSAVVVSLVSLFAVSSAFAATPAPVSAVTHSASVWHKAPMKKVDNAVPMKKTEGKAIAKKAEGKVTKVDGKAVAKKAQSKVVVKKGWKSAPVKPVNKSGVPTKKSGWSA